MSLRELFGIEVPFIQAPMAGVQAAPLAVAISNAGGLGSLPAALLSPEQLRRELEAIRDQTRYPFNVNFFCHNPPVPDAERERAWRSLLMPYFEEFGIDAADISGGASRTPFNEQVADIVEPFAPAVVSFHFGLPSRALLQRVRSWGSRIIASATTVAEAMWLEQQGVDAVIAQGWEAGGHRGMFLTADVATQVGTFALVQQVARRTGLPVIAAGGIADETTVRAAFQLGASAVQVGTAFLLCPECSTSAIHRAALQSESARDTAVTNVFTGRPARGIVNRLMRDLGYINGTAPEFPLASTALAALRRAAELRGSGDFSPLWCGQNATGCKAIPAVELMQELVRGIPSLSSTGVS